MSAKSRPDRPDIGDALELAVLRGKNAELREMVKSKVEGKKLLKAEIARLREELAVAQSYLTGDALDAYNARKEKPEVEGES